MNNTIEYIFINPELKEITNIMKNTIKGYIEKKGRSYWKRLEYIYIYIIFDFLIK